MGARAWLAHGRRACRWIGTSTRTARPSEAARVAALGMRTGVTYDTGALVAGERNDRRMWALHAAFLAEEVVPTVPAPVLAEAWRGGSRQANLSRLLAMCEVEPMTIVQARQVGVLAGKSAHDDVVDVTVV